MRSALSRTIHAISRRNFSTAAGSSSFRPFDASEPRSNWSIDVHTHVYLPSYMKMLRERTSVPKVIKYKGEDRLIILPNEDKETTTAAGRPIGAEYYSFDEKIAFMDRHHIQASVLSLANPWLEFLSASEATAAASQLNDELQRACEDSAGRFYGFGVLPINQDVSASVKEVQRLATLQHIRGIIVGTKGLGKGLDDPNLLPLWSAVAENNMVVFLHPHEGVGNENYGGFGHSLFLALGFPFETTTCVARMILAGVFDQVPDLKMLLAHSGGTLPFLAGRLDSCVKAEPEVGRRLQNPPSYYLKNLFFDSLNYHRPAVMATGELVGYDKMMFGTDNPFFRPENLNGRWPCVDMNYTSLESFDPSIQSAIRRENAIRLLNIKL